MPDNLAYARETTLGQIAAEDMNKALVLKKFGLDFCCGGKRTLAEACASKQLDPAEVIQALEYALPHTASTPLRYREWPLSFLADFIVQTHHAYVRRTLPELMAYATKVARVHGDRHPELEEILQHVREIDAEMTAHMFKEEHILFPYIKQMEAGSTPAGMPFTSVEAPISMMEMEHEQAGGLMESIRALSDQYTPPEGACGSYRLLFQLLEGFEQDLHTHVHLENNILFPGAMTLENKQRLPVK